MNQIKCECCGATLKAPQPSQRYLKCDYCGATYERNENSVIFDSIYKLPTMQYKLREPGFIQKIETEVVIPEINARMYTDEQIDHYVRNQMAEQIAELIAKHIKIYNSLDIMHGDRYYHGIVKVDMRGNGVW